MYNDKFDPLFWDVYELTSRYPKRSSFIKDLRNKVLDKSDPVVVKALRAREILMRRNEPLVWSTAKKIKYHSCSYDELVQVGRLGLQRAIESFKPTLGYRFSTHAVRIIYLEMTGASIECREIRLPSTLLTAITKARRDALSSNTSEIRRVCQKLGYNENLTNKVIRYWHPPVSLGEFCSQELQAY